MIDDLEPTFDDDSDPFDPADRANAIKRQAIVREQQEDEATAFLRNRRDAYQRVFGTADGRIVLADLRRFCRIDSTPWDADARIHAMLTGRYEVGRRILDHTDLTFDQLVEKYMREPS